jgi:hypothetical protein
VKFTDHAVRRYQERVRPTLGLGQCRRELTALAEMAGEPSLKPPPWLTGIDTGNESYLELAEGICAPLKNGYVVTVMTAADIPPHEKEARRAAKRKRKRERRRLKSYGSGDRSHVFGGP